MTSRTQSLCATRDAWRRRRESNPRPGFCRPLPEPLGYAAARVEVRRARASRLLRGGRDHATMSAYCARRGRGDRGEDRGARRDESVRGQRRGARERGPAGRRVRAVLMADVGSGPRADVRDVVPGDRSRERRRPAQDLVLQRARRRHRDPCSGRRHRLRRRLVGTLLRAQARRTGSNAGCGARNRTSRSTPGRSCRRPRSRPSAASRPCTSAAARRCMRSAASDGNRALEGRARTPKATPTTPPRSSPRPSSSDGLVVFGWDVHNSTAGEPAGVLALDAGDRRERWRTVLAPTEGDGATGPGCADVWASPTIDDARRLVFVGTGNCVTSPRRLRALRRGRRRPRSRRRFECGGRTSRTLRTTTTSTSPARRTCSSRAGASSSAWATRTAPTTRSTARPASWCGLRRSSRRVSRTRGATSPPAASSGRPRSSDGVITGGTAIGDAPYLHALDAATGAVLWQQPMRGADVRRARGRWWCRRDRRHRLHDARRRPRDRDVLWSDEVSGAVSGGAAIVSDDVFAVAGIREPGLGNAPATSGVYRFSLARQAGDEHDDPCAAGRRPATAGDDPAGDAAAVRGVAVRRALRPRPAARRARRRGCSCACSSIRGTSTSRPKGSAIPLRGCGPAASRRKRARRATGSSSRSVTTTRKAGSSACSTPKASCSTSRIPRAGVTYNRITILAITDSDALPSPAEGVDRLVVTKSFDPPLLPARPAKETT